MREYFYWPLPPEIFLYLGSARRQEIIEIHHGVHPGVQEREEPTVTSSNKPGKMSRFKSIMLNSFSSLLCSEPTLERHDSVMIDVEEGEMAVFLLCHKEERVKHVEELGHVEQPGHVQGSQGLGAGMNILRYHISDQIIPWNNLAEKRKTIRFSDIFISIFCKIFLPASESLE